jgi:hypothetical protein
MSSPGPRSSQIRLADHPGTQVPKQDRRCRWVLGQRGRGGVSEASEGVLGPGYREPLALGFSVLAQPHGLRMSCFSATSGLGRPQDGVNTSAPSR